MQLAVSFAPSGLEKASEPQGGLGLLPLLLLEQQETAVEKFANWHEAAEHDVSSRYRDLLPLSVGYPSARIFPVEAIGEAFEATPRVRAGSATAGSLDAARRPRLGDSAEAAHAAFLDLTDDRPHIGREGVSGLLTSCIHLCTSIG